uniref:Uncharacterized protein n=1 Tax=Trichuris muris TaxID=70415 RepID=A0A5S6Q6F7_TRIMR
MMDSYLRRCGAEDFKSAKIHCTRATLGLVRAHQGPPGLARAPRWRRTVWSTLIGPLYSNTDWTHGRRPLILCSDLTVIFDDPQRSSEKRMLVVHLIFAQHLQR